MREAQRAEPALLDRGRGLEAALAVDEGRVGAGKDRLDDVLGGRRTGGCTDQSPGMQGAPWSQLGLSMGVGLSLWTSGFPEER